MKPSATNAVATLPRKARKRKMAKKHLGCADSNCGYYWQDEDDDYPRCHFDGYGKAPCEEDDWDEE
jgi:hypothetical protein